MTQGFMDAKAQLVEAACLHVPFDGWSEATFDAAVADSGLDPVMARAICPRGGVDLALAYHLAGNQKMLDRLADTDLSALRYSERIAAAVRFRLEVIEDKELVRRGTTLFALPTYAADGAKAIWDTCDAIWEALGDTSRDGNWYSKRATLAGVYSSTVLYWLGDDSPDHAATWEFLDRRIENVMAFEKFKAQARENPLLKPLMAGPAFLMERLKAPERRSDMPGSFGTRR